jgi:hypothetical protein
MDRVFGNARHSVTTRSLRSIGQSGWIVRSEALPAGTELPEWLRVAHDDYARPGLAVILDTVRSSSGGQVARLVRFLASLYLKYDCPFELTDLRTLDTALANACLDYLNYDRLGICDLDRHLADGGAEVAGWIRDYGHVPRASEG